MYCTYQTWPGIIKLFPAMHGSLVSDIPAGDGKTTKLFLQCIFTDILRDKELCMFFPHFSLIKTSLILCGGVQPASVCISAETQEKVFSIVMTRAIFLKMNTIFCSSNYSIHGFPYNLLPVSCDDIGFATKSIGQLLARILGLKEPLLSFGPSCPCKLMCQRIVMAVWPLFLKLEATKQPILFAAGSNTHPSKLHLKKERQMTILICSGLLYPTGWAAQPSEDISRHFLPRAEKPSDK
jgi:hypothetical protein